MKCGLRQHLEHHIPQTQARQCHSPGKVFYLVEGKTWCYFCQMETLHLMEKAAEDKVGFHKRTGESIYYYKEGIVMNKTCLNCQRTPKCPHCGRYTKVITIINERGEKGVNGCALCRKPMDS